MRSTLTLFVSPCFAAIGLLALAGGLHLSSSSATADEPLSPPRCEGCVDQPAAIPCPGSECIYNAGAFCPNEEDCQLCDCTDIPGRLGECACQ